MSYTDWVTVIENFRRMKRGVAHRFTTDRLIVDSDGAFILCDRIPDGNDVGCYEWSGNPATAEEEPILARLNGNGTTVTVTDPNGTIKTYEDG